MQGIKDVILFGGLVRIEKGEEQKNVFGRMRARWTSRDRGKDRKEGSEGYIK